MQNRIQLVQLVFGSHLYGLNTPDSDIDTKGVFLPSLQETLLGKIPKSVHNTTKKDKTPGVKNTSEDVDSELYSLHYFIHLACEGETVALDMLHAREDAFINKPDPLWLELHNNRARFYTKNLNALVGYARKQAAKYGIRGSRLEEGEKVLAFLKDKEAQSPGIRLEDVWDEFPTGEHITKESRTFPEVMATAVVCGKTLQSTARVRAYVETFERFVTNYGERARLAKTNEGIDWKAISHAFRAAFQVRAILRDGDFKYPLTETDLIRSIKVGALDYTTGVAPQLDTLMDEVEELARNSSLPEKVDRPYWDGWIVDAMWRNLIPV